MQYLRNRKHVQRFCRIIEIRGETWENERTLATFMFIKLVIPFEVNPLKQLNWYSRGKN